MRVKRKCELCSNLARIYCGSDQANLCYECDSKVHSANFVVAKHSRTLLCHICQSPTLWTGSGPKFGSTISVCPTCLSSNRHHRDVSNPHYNNHEDNEDLDDGSESDQEDDDDDDDGDKCYVEDDNHNGVEDDDDDDDDEHEDDEENQVVPWSNSVSHPL